jgi:hypothetical protein
VEGGADSCGWRRVAVAGEISAWNWRGTVGWRPERADHELSKPIAGMGHSRGWQPGWKVSTISARCFASNDSAHDSPAGSLDHLDGNCSAVGLVANREFGKQIRQGLRIREFLSQVFTKDALADRSPQR